ncbi:hypothetical protein T4B_6545 [Trichinella pseudospiralis]|uniref:Uncharacterized protein n=1 Tax=Trichinella pseudospiralis TaxID=6337 RepID=A0A0V1IGH8_TRIPS|nr:hypothetical protein T4B_6545 [Trichinella pseudospiralis]
MKEEEKGTTTARKLALGKRHWKLTKRYKFVNVKLLPFGCKTKAYWTLNKTSKKLICHHRSR